MSLIRNERTKLLANSLDRASTACVAAGFVAPAVAQAAGTNPAGFTWLLTLSTIVWILAAVALHLIARRVLGGLVE